MTALEVTKPVSTPFGGFPFPCTLRPSPHLTTHRLSSSSGQPIPLTTSMLTSAERCRGVPEVTHDPPCAGPSCLEPPSLQWQREHRCPFPRADAPSPGQTPLPQGRRPSRQPVLSPSLLPDTASSVPQSRVSQSVGRHKPRPAVAKVAALPHASLMTLDQYLPSPAFSVLVCEMGVVVPASWGYYGYGETRCEAPGAPSAPTSDGCGFSRLCWAAGSVE